MWSPLRDENGEVPLHIVAREHADVAEELGYHWGLDSQRIAALLGEPPDVFTRAFMRLRGVNAMSGAANDVAITRRLRFVFEEIEDRDDWDRVLTLALNRYPLDSKACMSEGSGAAAVTLPPSG